MRLSKYKFVFNAKGEIFHSNAPFYNPDQSKTIGDYLPVYTDFEAVDLLHITPTHPYEFNIKDTKFFADLKLKELDRNGETFYELTLLENTEFYNKFQTERSQKNKNRIENVQLRAINQRLMTKLEESEKLLTRALNLDIRFPMNNIKSILQILNKEKLNAKNSKIIETSLSEIDQLDKKLKGIIELQQLTNAKSFEDSYYCSLIEIIEDAKKNIKVPTQLELSLSLDKEKMLFVNKYHFSSIIQKLISFFYDITNPNLIELKISSEVNADIKQIGILILSSVLNKNDKQEIIKHMETPYKSESFNTRHVNLELAKKIIKLYNGKMMVELTPDQNIYVSLSFDHLPYKDCPISN